MTVAVSGDSITFPDNSVQATAPKVGMVNRIINGAMVIDQRNAGASVTLTNQGYGLDRWTTWFSQTSKYTVQQNQGSVTPPTGFANYQGVTSSSAYTVAVGDYFGIGEKIEGYNIADFGWGTAGAQTITISFWVRSSLTGNFGAVLRSGDGGRYFAFTYPISAANTWEYKTVTIAGDTGGTWSTTNTTGIFLLFGLGTGANQTASANNTWIAGGVLGALGAVSVVGTSGATFYITGVQLEKGSTATSFDYRPYGTELGLCQRYFQRIASGASGLIGVGWFWTATVGDVYIPFKTSMRASPSISQVTGTNYFNLQALSTAFNFSGFAGIDMVSSDGVALYATGLPSGTVGATGYMYTNNAASFLAMTAEL